jgi:hypothetical protein
MLYVYFLYVFVVCVLYSGKITRGGNFRYIGDLNTSANLRNCEYLYIKLKNVCVICLGNQIREFKNPRLCLNKIIRENYDP